MGPIIYIATDAKIYSTDGTFLIPEFLYIQIRPDYGGIHLALIPIIILFVCCQKYIVRGIAMSGMKG